MTKAEVTVTVLHAAAEMDIVAEKENETRYPRNGANASSVKVGSDVYVNVNGKDSDNGVVVEWDGNCIIEEDHEVKSESDSVTITMNQQEVLKPVEEKGGVEQSDDKVDDLVNGVSTDDDATHKVSVNSISSNPIVSVGGISFVVDVQSNQYNGNLADLEMASKLVGKSLDVVSGLKSETNVSSDSIAVVESNPAEKTCGVTNGGIQFGSFDDKAERETPFNNMIRVPRNYDERLKVMIRLAQNKVDEKIRIRHMIHIDMQSTWVTCEEYRNDFSDAVFQEQVARDLHRSKCQEIEWMQTVIDIEDIEVKIRNMEWTMQHQTLPLKDEKLSSTMSRQDENQQGLDRKERLKSLKKEADQLRANLINAVAITEVTKRKYYNETEKLSESLYLLKAADDNQEEAYAQLQSLKKQLYEKNQHFRQYRDDFIKANELGWKGDKVALQNFCINQVRLRTLDGRALGPGEVPPVIHRAVNGRALVDHTMSGLTLEDRTQELVAVAKAEKVLAEKVVEQKMFMKSAPPESVSTTASNGYKIEEAEEEKPERTKEADESDRKAEELRKEEEAAKLKEQRQLEEIAKAEEAQERKRQKAEKKREKRAKNKENQKAVATAGDTGIEDEAVSACPTSETLAETSKETENKEKPMVATTGTPQKVSKFDSKPVTLGWRYPPHGWLKFNVSGMATEEAMGCGDKEGNVRALFSGPCDAINADSTELGAIITSLRPWSQQTTVDDMERRLACVGEVAFSKADQHGNEMAETLASIEESENKKLKAAATRSI
ncbi:uncharacterized protein LOC108451476 [Gossypium arboreum]|nr:uncharacterized protein LOC108451476 [Gossypium arboreum]